MKIQPKTMDEITNQAIDVLTRELGVAHTIRFINQFSAGYGDYTTERAKLFENASLDEILEEMRKHSEANEG